MAVSFSHQTALVTGAAAGLGLAVARSLAVRGVQLALMDINAERLQVVRRSSDAPYMPLI